MHDRLSLLPQIYHVTAGLKAAGGPMSLWVCFGAGVRPTLHLRAASGSIDVPATPYWRFVGIYVYPVKPKWVLDDLIDVILGYPAK